MFDADDDELDFAPAAGSKLASVFGLEKTKENGNPSLVYTPEKKPKPVEQACESQPLNAPIKPKPQATIPKFSVVIADIVHSFKLDAGVYSDQRKVGIAVLGNAQAHVFQVLLYKTTTSGKQEYIAVAKINSDFRFLVQPKFYCSFYDDSKNYWSLVFNCQDACMQFARQVGAAHFRAIYGKAVVTQMIDPGDEGCSQADTTHLTISQQNFNVNSIVPYNPIEATIKVSLNPSQAKWSEGLVSASPNSKWAIFIPASTHLPWATQVSPSPLVLEVVVEKMLHTTPSSHPAEPEKDVSCSEEGNVEDKGAPLTESPASSRANIISRVARMGQQTLPLKGAVFSNPTDSEDTEEETSSAASTNTVKLPPKFTKGRSPGSRHQSSESDQSYSAKPTAPTTWRPAGIVRSNNKLLQYVSGDGQMMALPPAAQQYQLVASTPVTSPSEPVSMFISEARIQNTEMRMNMNRIIDKIDTLSTKVDGISNGSPTRSYASSASSSMDACSLLSSIEKLVKDNQSLVAEVAEKNAKLNDLNERVFTLVNTNTKLLEQNKTLLDEKQRAPTESAEAQLVVVQTQQIETLEKEKAELNEKVADLEKCVKILEDSNSDLKKTKDCELSAKDSELSQKDSELRNKDSELNDLRISLTGKEAELNDLRRSLEQRDTKVQAAENKADRYEADNCELKELVTSLSVNINELETTVANLRSGQEKDKNAFESQKKTLEETIALLKSQVEAAPKPEQDYESVVLDLKLLMNKVYRKISQYFEGTNTVSGAVVRQTVAVVLKSEVTQYSEELLLKKNRPKVKNEAAPASSAERELIGNPPVCEIEPAMQSEEGSKVHSIGISSSQPTAVTGVVADTGVEDRSQPKTKEDARTQNEFWRSEPPPVPKFEDDEDESDEWLNM